ncbi:MAG: hypothetical protein M1546_15500 [Chloroflexi bacterium]|nr:hypothetical protein [Chloroflexota bacterium]
MCLQTARSLLGGPTLRQAAQVEPHTGGQAHGTPARVQFQGTSRHWERRHWERRHPCRHAWRQQIERAIVAGRFERVQEHRRDQAIAPTHGPMRGAEHLPQHVAHAHPSSTAIQAAQLTVAAKAA